MEIDARLKNAVQILQSVLANGQDAKSALSLWLNIGEETDPLLKEIWHDLTQYVNNVDLRKKDPKYEVYQRSILESGLEILRQRLLSQVYD